MNPAFIELDSHTPHLALDIRLATSNNFTGQPIYNRPAAYLHKDAWQALQVALKSAEKLGFTILVWDAFRPQEAQQRLWDHTPDETYISHPVTGTRPHCRGVAIDLTLVDSNGQELDMGTGFDDFRPLAHHNNTAISTEALHNRLILAGLMHAAGFVYNPHEWWHYQLPNLADYPIMTDISAGTGLLSNNG